MLYHPLALEDYVRYKQARLLEEAGTERLLALRTTTA